MQKATVYFTKDITPEGLQKVYRALGVELPGKVAVKISTGEPGGHNFLQPALIAPLVQAIGGTIVESNTAYAGRRDTNEAHWQTFKDHRFAAIAPCDLLDEEGELILPVDGGEHRRQPPEKLPVHAGPLPLQGPPHGGPGRGAEEYVYRHRLLPGQGMDPHLR